MKKSLLATGIIVALGVVWTGGAWFTGKQLEGRLAGLVNQANEQIKHLSPETDLELRYQNYQRGIFSSHLQVVASPVAGGDNLWLKPGQKIALNVTVSHGPLPLAQLTPFNSDSLLPSMAVVKATLVNNDVTRPLFAMAKGDSPVEMTTRIGYGGNTRSIIALTPLNYDNADKKLAFSGGVFRFDTDKANNALSLSGQVQSTTLSFINAYRQKVQLTFDNLQTQGSTRLSQIEQRVGSQTLSLGQMTIAVEGQQVAVLEKMNIDAKSGLSGDGKTINSQLDYQLNSLKIRNQQLGGGGLTLKAEQIDAQAWRQFRQQYNAQVQALLAQEQVMRQPEIYQQKVMEAFLDALPLLLKGEPRIAVAPLGWKNAGGEAALNLSLLLKAPATTGGAEKAPMDTINHLVKSLDARLSIPVDMAVELMTQIAMLDDYPQEEATKLANQQVKGLAAMGQMFRLTTVKDNIIATAVNYTNGEISLNGRKMPLDEFARIFGIPSPQLPETPVTPRQ